MSAAKVIGANDSEGHVESGKRKAVKRKKHVQRAAHLCAGNHEEASSMRKRLGMLAADPKSATAKVGFSFDFQIQSRQPSRTEHASARSSEAAAVDDGALRHSSSTPAQPDANAASAEHQSDSGIYDCSAAAALVQQAESCAASDVHRSGVDASTQKRKRMLKAQQMPGEKAEYMRPLQTDLHAAKSLATLRKATTEAATSLSNSRDACNAKPSSFAPTSAENLERAPQDVAGAENVDADVNVPRRVYIGGMPFWYTEESIRECWEQCGPIESLTMLAFPDTGNFRGIVFITFETEEAFATALGYHSEQLDGKTLVVKPCRAPPRRGAHTELPGRVKGYNVLFVGNIPWEVHKSAIEELFSSFSPKFVRMFDDAATGRHRGFAHIHFEEADSVDRALTMDGQSMFGRNLKVMYAQPSQARQKPKLKGVQRTKRQMDASADLLDTG